MSELKYYAYLGDEEIGRESLGEGGSMFIGDLRDREEVLSRCNKFWKGRKFRVYSYTSFFRVSTFRRVY